MDPKDEKLIRAHLKEVNDAVAERLLRPRFKPQLTPAAIERLKDCVIDHLGFTPRRVKASDPIMDPATGIEYIQLDIEAGNSADCIEISLSLIRPSDQV